LPSSRPGMYKSQFNPVQFIHFNPINPYWLPNQTDMEYVIR
jgi:hypothetical protein